MQYTESEVMQFVEENDIKFIRLAFCDAFGVQKNISIQPSELPRAFAEGISFNGTKVVGFGDSCDMRLVPEPGKASLLPWRPSHGRVMRLLCTVKSADGSLWNADSRYQLRRAAALAADKGYSFTFGTDCEFYLFKLDELGEPTKLPFDFGGYMDIAPADRGENVRREICLTLETMDIKPILSHHEAGPGQNEIDFAPGGALEAADNFSLFRTVVSTIASQNGIYANFSPKPLAAECGNGLHVNMQISKYGKPITSDAQLKSFAAGIMRRLAEMTVFFNPTEESYRRLSTRSFKFFEFPYTGTQSACATLLTPDTTINPYICFSLMISAGLEGLEEALAFPETLPVLPQTLAEAARLAAASEFIKENLPLPLASCYYGERI